MKKAFVISVQPTKFNAIALKSNLEENLLRISRLGYDGVELAVRNPEEIDVEKVVGLCKAYDLPIVAIGTGQAWGEEGLSLTDPLPETRKGAINRLKSHIQLASFNRSKVIIGLIRGMYQQDVSTQQTMEWLIEGILECVDFAKKYPGVTLSIEPINRYETNMINTIQEGIDLLNLLKLEEVGLLVDTFHMNIEEADLLNSIKLAGGKINHVHFADSNRWAPGRGHIDFKSIVTQLHEINYSGFISAEILPKPFPDSCVEETLKYFRDLEHWHRHSLSIKG